MKPKHIHTGEHYIVRINQKHVEVCVEKIEDKWDTIENKEVRIYYVTVIETGKILIIFNHKKFRRAVNLDKDFWEKYCLRERAEEATEYFGMSTSSANSSEGNGLKKKNES